MPSLEQRLAALERQDESRAGVLVVFEPLDDEQYTAAEAAEATGLLVIKVTFG